MCIILHTEVLAHFIWTFTTIGQQARVPEIWKLVESSCVVSISIECWAVCMNNNLDQYGLIDYVLLMCNLCPTTLCFCQVYIVVEFLVVVKRISSIVSTHYLDSNFVKNFCNDFNIKTSEFLLSFPHTQCGWLCHGLIVILSDIWYLPSHPFRKIFLQADSQKVKDAWIKSLQVQWTVLQWLQLF